MASLKSAALAAGLALFGIGAALAQSSLVVFYGPLARVITPNGDGVNDKAFFCFENPQDSEITGKIFTLAGSQVGSMSRRTDRVPNALSCPASIVKAQFVTWDGTGNGSRVDSGIYVYRIEVEKETFTGTLLVVR